MKTVVATSKSSQLFFGLILVLCLCAKTSAQDSLGIITMEPISMSIKGFTAKDFIKSTQKDTSFLRAFKNLRVIPHTQSSTVWVYKKDGEEKAKMSRETKHNNVNNQHWITTTKESTTGKYYSKKKEPRYFTSKMFNHVFHPRDTSFASNTETKPYVQQDPSEKGKIQKYYEQLKTFIFAPGAKVDGVPFIGNKLDIFGDKMKDKYDFTLKKVSWQDSIPCYLFAVTRKKGVKHSKVVIQTFNTYYDRRTMKIISRNYHITESTIAFSFDITLNIDLQLVDGEYFPSLISYQGDWDVPFKKREKLSFEIRTKLDN